MEFNDCSNQLDMSAALALNRWPPDRPTDSPEYRLWLKYGEAITLPDRLRLINSISRQMMTDQGQSPGNGNGLILGGG
jgi:hypothetical protein